MKTAISIPDDTFERAELLAKRLRVTRSELYQNAIEHYLKVHEDEALTANFNKLYGSRDVCTDVALRTAARRAFDRSEW